MKPTPEGLTRNAWGSLRPTPEHKRHIVSAMKDIAKQIDGHQRELDRLFKQQRLLQHYFFTGTGKGRQILQQFMYSLGEIKR